MNKTQGRTVATIIAIFQCGVIYRQVKNQSLQRCIVSPYENTVFTDAPCSELIELDDKTSKKRIGG